MRTALKLICLLIPAALPAQGRQATLVREIAITDNAVPKGFTTIGTVVVGPRRQLYVAQPQDNVVRMFDSTGKFVRSIGRTGGGPGETNMLSGVGFLNDSLWTFDSSTRRFAFFGIDGTYRSTSTIPGIIDSTHKAAATTLLASVPLASGHFYFGLFSSTSQMSLDLSPPAPIVIGTRDGKIVRVVTRTDSMGRGSYWLRSGGRVMFTSDSKFPGLVNTATLVAVGGNGEWFALARREECGSKSRYTVARTSLSGDTIWKGSVECPSGGVPSGFIDSVVTANRERITKTFPVPPSYADAQIRAKMRAQRFTPVRAMQTGNDGSVWIRPFTAVGDSIETWVRADATAGMSTRFTLPPRSQLKAIVDATRIWVMQLDDDDLPTLIRYRMN